MAAHRELARIRPMKNKPKDKLPDEQFFSIFASKTAIDNAPFLLKTPSLYCCIKYNLAIKSILDAIVPLVCVDDATRYCDNFYLSQHDMNEFSELYIVRKGCTKAWAAAHKELDFARAII